MVPPQARAQSDTPVDQEGEQASAQAARESLGAGPPCGHLGSGRGGPEGAAQSRTGPRACLAKPCRLCQEPLRPTEVCVRRTPVHGHGAVPAQARPGTGQSVWRTRGSGGMSGVCTHVSACTRTWLCGAQVPMVTVQQQGRARRCQSRGKGRPVRPGLSGTAVGLFHCRARSWSGSHTDTHTSGAGQPGPAGRGRVALRLKDGNQNNRKADEIGTCGESWLPARRWRGAVQVQSHSGAWAGRSAEARTSPT